MKLNKPITYIKGAAGVGKTQFLVELANTYRENKIHYISLGRENSKETQKRMPSNVSCSSFHSLAKKKVGIDSRRIISSMTLGLLIEQLKSLNISMTELKIAESLNLLLSLFCLSNNKLNRCHELYKKNKKIFPYLDSDEETELYKLFIAYWDAVFSPKSNIGVTHDMYLKFYELNVGRIDLDILFVDEGQDMNDTMLSIVDKLSILTPSLKIVVLFDINQSIFSFRGASTQLSLKNADLNLNKTHRFGGSLTKLVNKFMHDQATPMYQDITDNGKETTLFESSSLGTLCERISRGDNLTVISRFNATLWHIVKNVTLKGIDCHILGTGIDDLTFLESLYQLKQGKRSSHPKLKTFRDYEQYKIKAEGTHDLANLFNCKFVETLGDNGREVFSRLKKHLVPINKAKLLLATTHQTKGLEFNHVVMTDDFKKCYSARTNGFFPVKEEDRNIIYTALTRAKLSLTLPKSWQGIKT